MLASDESLAWLWEKKLAFVGADNPVFESLPFNKTIGGVPRSLHQVFIGGESSRAFQSHFASLTWLRASADGDKSRMGPIDCRVP